MKPPPTKQQILETLSLTSPAYPGEKIFSNSTAVGDFFDIRGKPFAPHRLPKIGYYPYLWWCHTQFCRALGFLQYRVGENFDYFIDLGSGIGDKILIARQFGIAKQYMGLELNEELVKFSRMCFVTAGITNVRIKRRNIVTFRYDKFSEQKVFYYCWWPLSSSKMAAFYDKILGNMSVGSVLFDPYLHHTHKAFTDNDSFLEKIFGNIKRPIGKSVAIQKTKTGFKLIRIPDTTTPISRYEARKND